MDKQTPPLGLDRLFLSIELRDLFALGAMVAMMPGIWGDEIPEAAYELADKMLEARETTRQKEQK